MLQVVLHPFSSSMAGKCAQICLFCCLLTPTDMTVCQRITWLQHRMKKYIDAKQSAYTPSFQEGDKVTIQNPLHVPRDTKFTDPLTVAKKMGVGTYFLSDGKTFPGIPTTLAENTAH